VSCRPGWPAGWTTALARDLLQEIFIKALRMGSRFCVANARAWLFEVSATP
jgi:DNA-directed RNA polymerase specialized sigma24 family protein